MSKALILFGSVGWNIAETTRAIEIARACGDRFEPHFASYGGQFEHLIEEAGFPLHHLKPAETPEKIDYLWRVDRMETFGQPFTVEELRQRVQSELALIEQLRPRAISMGSVLTFPISARVAGVPLVNVVPLAMSRPFLEAGLPLAPDIPDVLNGVIDWITLNVPLMTQNFSRVAREYGLPRFRSLVEVWEGDWNLATEIPALSRLDHLPPNWRFVGPIYAHLPGEVPEDVRKLADDQGRPLVYFAMGSSGNKETVKLVTESFEGLPVNVVAPIKAHIEGTDTRVPENMLVTDWLPAPEVNAICDMGVIHGGQGTVQTACAAGLPFIGIGMQPEQSLNIEAVARYGSAKRISRAELTREGLREAILSMLKDETAKRKAQALKAEFERWNGTENAAQFLIEQFGDPRRPVIIPKTPYTARQPEPDRNVWVIITVVILLVGLLVGLLWRRKAT